MMITWLHRLHPSILTVICLCFLGLPEGVSAYSVDKSGEAAPHNFMLRKAVSVIYSRYHRYDWPLLVYLLDLNFGSWYADHSELRCTWNYFVGSRSYSCDQLHHYGRIGDVIVKGFVVGNTGDFAAPDYAAALYDLALDFWPGEIVPALASLPRKHGGKADIPGGSAFDFGPTHLGGWPLCNAHMTELLTDHYQSLGQRPYEAAASARYELKKNPDYCPKWPPWATSDKDSTPLSSRYKTAVESRERALYYLGWALHLIQDITVPPNAMNYADEQSEAFESAMKEGIAQGRFDHLPLYEGVYREDPDTEVYNPHAGDNGLSGYPGFRELAFAARRAAVEYSGIEELGDGEYAIRNLTGLHEKMMDVAIKLTALGLDTYFWTLKERLYERAPALNPEETASCGVIVEPKVVEDHWQTGAERVCFELSVAERDDLCRSLGAWKSCTTTKCGENLARLEEGLDRQRCEINRDALRIHTITACADYRTLICGSCECYLEGSFRVPPPAFEAWKCTQDWYRTLHKNECEDFEGRVKRSRLPPGPDEALPRDADRTTEGAE